MARQNWYGKIGNQIRHCGTLAEITLKNETFPDFFCRFPDFVGNRQERFQERFQHRPWNASESFVGECVHHVRPVFRFETLMLRCMSNYSQSSTWVSLHSQIASNWATRWHLEGKSDACVPKPAILRWITAVLERFSPVDDK